MSESADPEALIYALKMFRSLTAASYINENCRKASVSKSDLQCDRIQKNTAYKDRNFNYHFPKH